MSYILRAHVYARAEQALENYRQARRFIVRRGTTGTWDDGHLRDAWQARIRWMAYRDLIEVEQRAEALIARAERAA